MLQKICLVTLLCIGFRQVSSISSPTDVQPCGRMIIDLIKNFPISNMSNDCFLLDDKQRLTESMNYFKKLSNDLVDKCIDTPTLRGCYSQIKKMVTNNNDDVYGELSRGFKALLNSSPECLANIQDHVQNVMLGKIMEGCDLTSIF